MMPPPQHLMRFFDTDLWREVSAVEVVLLVCIIAARVVIRRGGGLDYVMAMGSLVVVFCVAAYASVAALSRDLPPQDYNFYLAAAYLIALVTFLSPWRWGPFVANLRDRFRSH